MLQINKNIMKKYTYNKETLQFDECKKTPLTYVMLCILLLIFTSSSFTGKTTIVNPTKTVVIGELDSTKLTKENVWNFINEIGIKESKVVYQQIMVETGGLTSKICLENNNLIGLRFQSVNYKQYCIKNFKPREHLVFASWKLSLLHYKAFQDRYYHGGDYYDFLSRKKYAEDLNYVKALKQIKTP